MESFLSGKEGGGNTSVKVGGVKSVGCIFFLQSLLAPGVHEQNTEGPFLLIVYPKTMC